MGANIVFEHFPDLFEKQREQIGQLYPLYLKWNDKINVISRKDIDHLYTRHVLHSLAIAKWIQFHPNSNVLDLGTGGGFPGIPLAILFPESSFHLVDSNGKKIKVVEEVRDALELKNLSATHQRVEKVSGTYDFVVSRGVAKTKQLFIWTHKKIKNESKHMINNGWILLKGGDLSEELKEFGRSYSEINLQSFFDHDFFETKKIIYIPR